MSQSFRYMAVHSEECMAVCSEECMAVHSLDIRLEHKTIDRMCIHLCDTSASTFVLLQGITPLFSTLCGGGTISAQLSDAQDFVKETLVMQFYGTASVQEAAAASWNAASGTD